MEGEGTRASTTQQSENETTEGAQLTIFVVFVPKSRAEAAHLLAQVQAVVRRCKHFATESAHGFWPICGAAPVNDLP